jgi:hypothetical protein
LTKRAWEGHDFSRAVSAGRSGKSGSANGSPSSLVSLRFLDKTFLLDHIPYVAWEVEFTDEFEAWWNALSETEQEDVRASVNLLRERGPSLGRPHADLITTSQHPNMKELRTQHRGRPYRTLFAFDPRRVAILLIGGDKTGNDRWYEEFCATCRQDLHRAFAGD